MAGQQYNPLSFLIMLGLLSFSPVENVNKGLESLGFTLDATARSLENVKTGIDTLDSGLRQFAQYNTGYANLESTDTHGTNFNDTDFAGSEFNATVDQNHGNSVSSMPADAPGHKGETTNRETE